MVRLWLLSTMYLFRINEDVRRMASCRENRPPLVTHWTKMRAKIMIYPHTDLHFWSPPILVYSGHHLLWWYMQPQWWSKWCLVLACQWPFPVGNGGEWEEEDKVEKNDKLSWKSDILTPIFPSCRTHSLVRVMVTQCSLYSFLYGMHCTGRLSPLVFRVAIPLIQPSQISWWGKWH